MDKRLCDMTTKNRVVDRPDLYDWLYKDETNDIPMYLALAAEHTEVLECGIGTGRIAIPMAKNGKTVYGIDNSDEMLLRLEDNMRQLPKAVRDKLRVFKADMRDFDLGHKFPFIYVPFSTFNYLLTIEDQRACLTAVRNHLALEGKLVLELLSFSYSPGWLDNQPVLRKVKEEFNSATGECLEMWKVGSFDCTTQKVTEDRHFKFYGSDGTLQREEVVFWENRFFLLSELQVLLDAAGYETDAVYGDYVFGPYRHESPIVVVVASNRGR
jgi:SAM-dependent methyltransferase